jgi:hypothetical protein
VKITNKLGLPEPLVRAIEADPYDNAGTLSVTTLLKPAQAIAIQHRIGEQIRGAIERGVPVEEQIVEDAADRIWSLMGQIGHSIIERAAPGLDPNRYIAERRFFMDLDGKSVPGFDPLRISGAADLIDVPEKTVYDFKFTSGWAVMDAQRKGKTDWRMQLSLLAMLAREGRYITGAADAALWGKENWRWADVEKSPTVLVDGPPIDITHGKIVAVVRDWTKTQALKNPEWPQQPVAVIDMDILPDAEVREWLDMRIEALKFALDGGDVPCTDEERWAKPGKWAVHKAGVAKAAKLADTEDELSSWIFANRAKLGASYRIEERPGTFNRCAQYCSAAPFCSQYQATLAASPDDELLSMPDDLTPYKPQL